MYHVVTGVAELAPEPVLSSTLLSFTVKIQNGARFLELARKAVPLKLGCQQPIGKNHGVGS